MGETPEALAAAAARCPRCAGLCACSGGTIVCRVGALRGKRAAAKEAKRKAELGGEAAKAAKVARSVGSAAGALAAAHAASKAPAPPVARNAFEMLLAQRAELAKELAAVKAEIKRINSNLDLENKSFHKKPCANFALTYQQKYKVLALNLNKMFEISLMRP